MNQPGYQASMPAPVHRARAWLCVAALCLAQIVSTADRGLLALVIDPVRADLGISEVQIAMLQGFAFAIFYVSVGIPLGFVADAVNRRRLLAAGIVVWSLATVFSGFASSFGMMFAARLAVGVGEAVLGPCAVGVIGEMFAPGNRGRPMSLYVLGSMIAYGVGSSLTGLILQAAPQGAFAGVPLLGALAPWRLAFVLFGLAGVPLVLLLVGVGDPARRGHTPTDRANGGQGGSVRQTLAALASCRRVLMPLYGAVSLFAVGAAAASGWSAAMLTRLYAASPAQVGQGLGVSQIIWALAGAALASVVVDKVGARHGLAGKIRFAALLALLTIPSCLGVFAPGYGWAVTLSGEVMFASALFGTTLLSILADTVPPQARGVSVALYAFVMTMIGGSLGPLAVATLTEHLFGSPKSVGLSMALVGGTALSAAAGLALIASRRAATH